MFRVAVILFLFSQFTFAQTAETSIFRAILLPASEVPAVNNLNARGIADIVVGVTRDASGQIASGTVDVLARVTFPAAVTATGLGIWSGNTGQAGSLVFNTALSAQSPTALQPNGDSIHLAAQVTPDNAAGVAALRNLFLNPTQYYVNILTTANPNGAMRGQLQRAQKMVLMALLSSNNVAPPVYPQGYGAALVVAIGTRDATGNWTSGEMYCSASYSTQDLTAFTSFQIHSGPPGVTGPLVFSAPLPSGLTPPPDGNGTVGPYYTEITTSTATQTAAFSNFLTNPGALYIDLHTSGSLNGSLRGQLHATDTMAFPMVLNSANEMRTPAVAATAPATLTLSTLRNEDGSIAAGTILTDLDFRIGAATQFFGLYLHQGAAGQEGPMPVQLAPDFHSDTGFGNYFGWSLPFSDSFSVAALNDLVVNPSSYYADLHTLADPGGAARAQFAAVPAATSTITAVVSANLDVNATTLSPGGLITVYGTNLAQVATDLSGWSGQTLPAGLNGVHLLIGGRPAALLYVSPGQINAQVPVDIAPPNAQLLVSNPAGPIASRTADVAPSAPAIFFYPSPAILKNSDFSLIGSANPAKPGDVLLVYATGLGRTNPPLTTGGLLSSGVIANTAPVTVTVGGKPASVIYSIASPAFPGLYQVAITVPSGIAGPSPLVLQQGGVSSNTVTLAMK